MVKVLKVQRTVKHDRYLEILGPIQGNLLEAQKSYFTVLHADKIICTVAAYKEDS